MKIGAWYKEILTAMDQVVETRQRKKLWKEIAKVFLLLNISTESKGKPGTSPSYQL
jgi:hypothetical protein